MNLLLQCARSQASGVPLGAEWLAPIRWDSFLELAGSHGLTAVAARVLRTHTAELPADFQRTLAQAERRAVQQSLRLTEVLGEVAGVMEAQGIRALAYKGPVLSAQLFREAALREAVDLDVLVSPRDVWQAVEAMSGIGFRPLRPYPPSAQGQLIRYRAEFGLMRDDLLLEVQWRLAPQYFATPFDFDRAWDRRTECALGGRKIATLGAEDNLFALCIHGSKHHWERLKWVLDLDLMIRRHPDLPWASVISGAARTGTLRLVLASLRTSHALLGTPLPGELEERLAADALARAASGNFIEDLKIARKFSEAYHHRTMLALRERRLDQLRYLTRLSYQPTESEWDAFSLPLGFQWIYYLARVVRVAGKAMRLAG